MTEVRTNPTLDLRYQMHTFGCKVNTYDSGLMQKNLKMSGFANEIVIPRVQAEEGRPRIHVLNTCAVTQEATKEAVRLIRRLKAQDPFCTVVVTGCAAQVDTGVFEKLPGADLVIANSHKSQLPEILLKFRKGEIKDKVFRSNIFRNEELGAGGGQEAQHTRAFLKIQDGCNSFCSFCIIPYARGKSRSLTVETLVKKAQELESSGVREVVLTGIHIGDYLDESAKSLFSRGRELPALVEAMLLHTKNLRFRLGSLEPIELSDELMGLMSDPRICPHFHMSIQAGSTPVLSEMKRKYGRTEVESALQMIHRNLPKAYVGMDVIAGFPTETEEQFLETYQVLAENPWTRLHVFPYSERSGTRAAIIEPQIPMHERKQRAERLRDLSDDRVQWHAQKQIGSQKQTLLLNRPHREVQGLSDDYWHINIENFNDEIKVGQICTVNVTGVSNIRHGDVGLLGELVYEGATYEG